MASKWASVVRLFLCRSTTFQGGLISNFYFISTNPLGLGTLNRAPPPPSPSTTNSIPKMRALALTLLSLLAYTNIAAAATIPTLNNILTSPSKTTSARLAKRSAQVIDPRLHPDWAGELDPNDCERAMALFNNRAPQYSPYLPVWFWSARWMERPSLLNPNFELPFGTRYGKNFPRLSPC